MILNNRIFFWLLLSVPAVVSMTGWASGRIDAIDMLHPTGEWSARFLILSMMIGPALGLFGSRGWLNWLLARRRYLGVAAFIYAVLHLVFYIIDMGALDEIIGEILLPGIWTGWAALAIMLPLAITSNNQSMRIMKAGWKRMHRLVYPIALLTLLHWGWVHNGFTGAFVHFALLIFLLIAVTIKDLFFKDPKTQVI